MTKIRTFLPAALLLFSACATRSVILESRNYSRLGDHNRAFALLDQVRERQIDNGEAIDQEFEGEYERARKMYLLDRGRQLIFAEREDEALVDLAGVLAYEPNHAEAHRLVERALEKKAVRATAKGDDHLSKLELEEALTAYVSAERSIPGFPPAVEGADKVRIALAKLTTRAQQQFLEAVRKLPEFRFVEVRWHSSNAITNDPTREDADELKKRANHEIALATFARGRECQAEDHYGAALLDFRAAKKLDEHLEGIDAAIQEMTNEVQASGLVDQASMQMRVGKFDAARKSLDEAFALSKMARAAISELMIETRRLEGESMFDTAHNLEILGKKREAQAAYEALSAKWPEGLRDEKARIEGMRTDIEGAEKEWAVAEAAEAAGELAEALDHFQTSERFYAEYKNAKLRIAQLKEKLAPAGVGANSGTEAK
jgi:tetratricopeptide (TPR) repeat protein